MEKLLFDWSNDNAILMLQITFFLSVMSFIMCLILFYKRHKDELSKNPAIGRIPVDNITNGEYNPFEEGKEVSEETLRARPTSSPYSIVIKNNTDSLKKCSLFGLAENIFKKNLGSDEGISVSMGVSYVDYVFMLIQSAFEPFETGVIRLYSKNLKQLHETITITSKDANGQMCQIPLITENYIRPDGIGTVVDEDGKELGQDELKYIDIHYAVIIDVNTNFDLHILPNSELEVFIYPSKKFNSSRYLNGTGETLRHYSSPKINNN